MRLAPNRPTEFLWEGTDARGQPVRGQLRATGPALAQAQLRRQGITSPRVFRPSWRMQLQGLRTRGPRPHDLAVVLRQLATMIRAGLPLLQALDLMARGQHRPALAQVLQGLRHDVATGQGLAAAMQRHPALFPPLACQLVAMGESAGVLEPTLERLATHQERLLMLRHRVRAALLYPAAVTAVALLVIGVILVAVVPTFESVFASFGASLPAPTRLVVALSDTLARWWWVLAAAVPVLVWGSRHALGRWPRLRLALDAAALRLPVVGELLSRALLARWARTLSTLLGAGIALIPALGSVADVCGQGAHARATRTVQRAVRTGQRLASALQDAGPFPPMLVQMTAVGEESGSLEPMLAKVADLYESEVDEQIKGLSSLIEPLIIVVLGLLIGGIIVAMYLPIFQMGSMA